jgi:hypothetical protein
MANSPSVSDSTLLDLDGSLMHIFGRSRGHKSGVQLICDMWPVSGTESDPTEEKPANRAMMTVAAIAIACEIPAIGYLIWAGARNDSHATVVAGEVIVALIFIASGAGYFGAAPVRGGMRAREIGYFFAAGMVLMGVIDLTVLIPEDSGIWTWAIWPVIGLETLIVVGSMLVPALFALADLEVPRRAKWVATLSYILGFGFFGLGFYVADFRLQWAGGALIILGFWAEMFGLIWFAKASASHLQQELEDTALSESPAGSAHHGAPNHST